MPHRTRYHLGTIFSAPISVLFVTLSLSITGIHSQDLMCCAHTTGSCRSVCERISLVQLAADKELKNQTLEEVQKYCSSQLSSFWECLNATFKDMAKGEDWSGRICCPVPHSESCRRACITADSEADLTQGCRQSDEIAFFSCLDKQRKGEICCANAQTLDCRDVCLDIFKTQYTPSKHQRQKLKMHCEGTSPKVTDCIKDFIKVTPVQNTHKHMHCCDKSNNIKCRETCKNVLSTETTLQEIIDGLQLGGCGQPLLQEYFWQCFLKPDVEPVSSVEVSRIDRVGIDSAKWHCCQRANSQQCARLCSRTFSKYWHHWEEFQFKCLNQASEDNLRNCLDEVDEPCELGCDGLSFCTNFNNRPTELFRSCNSHSDDAARVDVTSWQDHNNLSLPGLTLPLKSISKCSPEIWKAVACASQIKPCSRDSHANQICRSTCKEILSQCVDWTRLSPKYSPDTICQTLSPEDPEASCISLENFLTPSTYDQRVIGQISSPCKRNPCEDNEICVINRNCLPGASCKPYSCQKGCKLGEVSPFMVPEGAYVRIPNPNNNKGCLRICKCSGNNIEQCQPLPCLTLTSCLLGSTQQGHLSKFELDCNSCSCYAGEVICSRKQCENSAISGRNTAYTTLPCNCPPHYVPVCGSNGITYPSSCLAKCAGLSDSDIEHYPCQNPCKPSTCPVGQKCVPNPQVCLSLMHKPCTQYQCINGSSNCAHLPKEPVCDIDNQQYDNPCSLAHHNAKLAYHGPCLKRCKSKGLVCAINGKTYSSECAAHADFVSVDYEGSCVAVGLISNTKTKQCSRVTCPKLPDPNCFGITPPGACCPVCGGAVRLLYSRKQIDRGLYALPNINPRSLNLATVLKTLERQILITQCTLRGFVTVEQDIFILVQSTERYPSELQLEACIREAEKIASLVNIQSPRIVSELGSSSLTAASLVHTQESSSNSYRNQNFYILVLILFLSQLF